jgi:PhnB protein
MNNRRTPRRGRSARRTSMAAKAIPDGYERMTPYLCVAGAADAIAFYVRAFGAVERMRLAEPDGRIGHAEIEIGGSPLMLSDEYPEEGVRSPKTIGGSPVAIHVYVDDVDALAARAAEAGATILRPAADQFYGDRTTTLLDPFGHRWFFATHKEDVSNEEMERRYAALLAQEGK